MGKTFVALDMALSIAKGLPFHGLPTKQGAVAYIAGEGARGLLGRIEAWYRSKRVDNQSCLRGFNAQFPRQAVIQAIKSDSAKLMASNLLLSIR